LVRTYTQFGWRSHLWTILLSISDDNANSFENPITISEDASAQSDSKISVFNDHIYVVWNVDDVDVDDQSDTNSNGGGSLYQALITVEHLVIYLS